MKFLKLLFGKTLIVFFAFVVQLLIIFGVIAYLNQYYAVLQLISFIIGLLAFFNLVNKKQTPEFKIPWMFLMLLFPFFGVLLYLFFANGGIPKLAVKKLVSRRNDCVKYTRVSEQDKSAVHDYMGDYKGIENYLAKTAFTDGHLNNRVTYFPTGEKFYADLLEELKKAQKFIFMEYFIIDKGKMWNSILDILTEKASNGVKVKVLYDDIGTLGKVTNGYYRSIRRRGIECHKFNPFRPIVSGVHNNRDHRKITVIDGKVGYTGGINLADEYINAKTLHGYWKDTAIKIEGNAVNDLTSMFIGMFDVTSEQVTDLDEFLNVQNEKFSDGGVVQVFGDGPNPVDNELIGLNNYVNLINSAKKYVYISTPYLIPDFTLISALRNAAISGVDVRLILPSVPDKKLIFKVSRSNYKYLKSAGVKIYEYLPGFIHAKGLIADDKIAFVGTVNLDFRSFVHHFECGAVLYNTPCIKDIKEDFFSVLEDSAEVDDKKCRFGLFSSIINSILNLFSPML